MFTKLISKPKTLLKALFIFAMFIVIAAIYTMEGGQFAKAALTIPTFGYVSLTEAVNKIKVRNRFLRRMIFGQEDEHATKLVQTDLIIGNRKIAPFVRRGAPGRVVDKLGRKTSLFEPPSIRLKKPLTADDLLHTRAPGSAVHVVSGSGDPLQNYRMKRIGMEQMDLKERIYAAEEWMCAQALSGVITYVGEEVEFSIDMQMPAANKPTLSGGALWSAPTTATPLADIRGWKVLVSKATGLLPTMAVMTQAVFEAAIATTEVKDYMHKLNIDFGEIKTSENIIEMGAERVARLNGVDWYVYNEVYDDAADTEQSIVAVDRFVLVTPNSKNKTHYGAIDDLEAGTVIGQLFSKDWIEKDPSVYNVLVESHPCPVIHRPETVVYAKVL